MPLINLTFLQHACYAPPNLYSSVRLALGMAREGSEDKSIEGAGGKIVNNNIGLSP